MTEVARRNETYPVPLTGAVVELSKPPEVAQALLDINQAFSVLREAKAVLEAALVDEARRHGAKSFDIGNEIQVELREDSKLVWDMEVLEELRAAGLPEDRWDELVQARIEYAVSARIASQLERSGNEEYERIIRKARQREEGRTRVSVRRKR